MRASSPARAVANVVADLVDAWDDEEKPARLHQVNGVHGHGLLAGDELPTARSSKPVAFAFAASDGLEHGARSVAMRDLRRKGVT